jgi:hypothetical protein
MGAPDNECVGKRHRTKMTTREALAAITGEIITRISIIVIHHVKYLPNCFTRTIESLDRPIFFSPFP